MSNEESTKQYRPGKIGAMVHYIADLHGLDEKYLRAQLVAKFPELKNQEECANCKASMAEYIFSVSSLDALLLLEMGRSVDQRLKKGMSFTEANKVHISTAIKGTNSSRQTISSKLGLITKVKDKEGNHDRKAGWLITKRGFEFLANKPVPKQVQVFRNEIIERFDKYTTLDEVMSRQLNYKKEYADCNFVELQAFSVAGFAQGTLL